MSPVAASNFPGPPRFAVYAHPWAFADFGVEAVLDELASLGVDGLQLALSYHVASFVSPRNPKRLVQTGDSGSLSLRYEPSPSSLRPAVNEAASEAVPVILTGAGERGIQVIAWLVYLYGHDLARRYPQAAVKNVFGDPHPAQLCPSSGLVREYVVGLTSAALELDVLTGNMSGLHAEALSFLPWDYGLFGLKSAAELGLSVRKMLSLCFCSACSARAYKSGLDAIQVRSDVAAWLRGGGGDPDSVADFEPYAKSIGHSSVELNREVRTLVASRGSRFSSTAAERGGDRIDEPYHKAVRPLVDEVRVKVGPSDTVANVRERTTCSLDGCAAATTAFAQYQIHQFSTADELLGAVTAAEQAGVGGHRFYEHSVMTEQHVNWLRRARAVIDG